MTGPLFSCTVAAFAAVVMAGTPAAPPSKPAPGKAPAETAPAAKKTSTKDAKAWAAKVQKAYEKVKDLSASFEQVTRFKGAGTTGPVSTGTLAVKKPGKMHWEFASPEPKSFISDGKTMWMYEPEVNQVIVNEFMADTTSVTALNFLEGLGVLEKSFDVAMAERPEDATVKTAVFLELTPKDQADVQFQKIVLAVDGKTGIANEVFLTDMMGSETRLTFRDIEINSKLPDSKFEFQIPKDAEVVKPALLQ